MQGVSSGHWTFLFSMLITWAIARRERSPCSDHEKRDFCSLESN